MTVFRTLTSVLIRPSSIVLLAYLVGLALTGAVVGYVLLIQLKPTVDAITFAAHSASTVQVAVPGPRESQARAVLPDATVQPLRPGHATPGVAQVTVEDLDLARTTSATAVLLDEVTEARVKDVFGAGIRQSKSGCVGAAVDENTAAISGIHVGDQIAVSSPAAARTGPSVVTVCAILRPYADIEHPQPQHGLLVIGVDDATLGAMGLEARDLRSGAQAGLDLVGRSDPQAVPATHALNAMGDERQLLLGGAVLFGASGWVLLVHRMTSMLLDRTLLARDLLRWWPVSRVAITWALALPLILVSAGGGAIAAWIAGGPALAWSLGTSAGVESIAVLAALLALLALPAIILKLRRRRFVGP